MKMILGVSKKHNSVWRVYYQDYNEDGNLCLFTKKINPLLTKRINRAYNYFKTHECAGRKTYSNVQVADFCTS